MSSETPPASTEEVGSPLPAVIAGVAILGVAAYLIFGSGGGSSAVAEEGARAGNQAAASDQAEARVHSGRVRGGVGARAADQAEGRPQPDGRRNPRLGGPAEGLTMAPAAPKELPVFETKAEEIAFYEKRLETEQALLTKRSEFVERMKKIQGEARTDQEREVAESRGKIVEKNYDDQLRAVEETKRKLAELRP